MNKPIRIVIDVKGGCLQAVYGDKLPDGVDVEFILRDWDNIEQGDPDPMGEGCEPDPMGEGYEPEVYYW